MRYRFARLLPRRIAAQSATVVVVSVVFIHIFVTAYFRLMEDRAGERNRGFAHVGTLVRLVAATEGGAPRVRLVADAERAFPSLDLKLSRDEPTAMSRPDGPGGFDGPGFPEEPGFPRGPGRPFDDVGVDVRVVEIGPPGGGAFGPGGPSVLGDLGGMLRALLGPPDHRRPPHAAFGFANGDWLFVAERDSSRPRPPSFLGPLSVSMIFAGMASLLLGLWAARGLVGPLRALAAAAREFDIDGETKPLPRRGPEEIRVAAAAFEAMRRRIRSLVDDRTRMLAAMGHDLRTPITRLRLRSEFVTDEKLRADILRDLAGMTEMIEGALTYLSEGRHAEPLGLVDLSAMIQTICDPWVDQDRQIDYQGPDHLVRRVRPMAMGRALSNLVDNALKYGRRCIVRLSEDAAGGVVVEVEDDGPGIPEADREAMLRPFVRGDAARNMDDHRGFGLGLAIVKAVIDGHGGRLVLSAAVPHGLIARVELPASKVEAGGRHG